MKPTAKQEIIRRLVESPTSLAVHEFNIFGHSETAISARLREMAKDGNVVGRVRPGTALKEWSLVAKLELIG